ncbi:YcxB family protein [Serpentinicella alkaliphila]|uniref:YcxB-like protein n=1 Tax=Serpentinicella alkaliphila TaxID=1734049 RepID=A0A4R2TBH5_9FIRM|nr:YcxB family protein [Serpentinicella alkaliphila]QUH26980.1 YcxB family protein [Serpentinicella alkaliphila]TCQ00578.1 YcxB-like protein [Serpentinicella alkaliphila]
MKISYTLNEEDQWYYLKYILKHHPVMRRSYIFNFIFTILTPPLLLGLIFIANLITDVYKLIFLFIFTELVLIYWYVTYPKRQLNKLLKTGLSLLGKYDMEISSEGIREIKIKKEVFVPWDNVKTITQDVNSIYIFTSDTAGYIIPKRDFSESEATELLTKLNTMYNNSII